MLTTFSSASIIRNNSINHRIECRQQKSLLCRWIMKFSMKIRWHRTECWVCFKVEDGHSVSKLRKLSLSHFFGTKCALSAALDSTWLVNNIWETRLGISHVVCTLLLLLGCCSSSNTFLRQTPQTCETEAQSLLLSCVKLTDYAIGNC